LFEQDKALEADVVGKKYTFIIDKPYRWKSWAAPKGKDGKLDHNTARTGDGLRDFVNQKLYMNADHTPNVEVLETLRRASAEALYQIRQKTLGPG